MKKSCFYIFFACLLISILNANQAKAQSQLISSPSDSPQVIVDLSVLDNYKPQKNKAVNPTVTTQKTKKNHRLKYPGQSEFSKGLELKRPNGKTKNQTNSAKKFKLSPNLFEENKKDKIVEPTPKRPKRKPVYIKRAHEDKPKPHKIKKVEKKELTTKAQVAENQKKIIAKKETKEPKKQEISKNKTQKTKELIETNKEETKQESIDNESQALQTGTKDEAFEKKVIKTDSKIMVIFKAMSTDLSLEARAVIEKLAKKYKNKENVKFKLLSYASSVDGQKRKSRQVSLARALKVRKILKDNGIVYYRIDVRALGDKIKNEKLKDRIDIIIE
jgi:outer membrane protein OmpA-like peptidoglycan-associated protein